MYIDFNETAEILRNCKDAIIITHKSPDGDCIGAGFGLKDILAELGIRSRVVCSDPFPKRYSFITDIGAGEEFEPQTVISVDLADKQLMGKYEEIYGDKVNLCIDHHISNKNYAEKTLLNADASSACEVIFELAEFMRVNITRHCVVSLYTGMSTDSGCFRYECTGARTHEIAGKMMRMYPDIKYHMINRLMFEAKSPAKLKLESMLFNLLESYCDGKIGFLAITQDMMKEMGIEIEELEGFAPATIKLDTAEIGILIREREKNVFKCSFRSVDRINVSEICETLGGGGHAKAAGCTMKGNLEDVKKILIDTARKAVEE